MPAQRLGVRMVEVNDYKAQPRRHRKPVEFFNLKRRPFEIVPFMIHPVLPGETLDNMFLQSSIVSDPVANRLIGWFDEKHIFYVPLRALSVDSVQSLAPADLHSLFLDPAFTMVTNYGRAANSVPFYEFKTGIPWVSMVYEYIVRRWFRDENEATAAVGTNGRWDDYFIAQLSQRNWANSLKEEEAGTDDPDCLDVFVRRFRF